MNNTLTTPKISEIKFAGRIYILRKNTEKKNVSLILHILGYQSKDKKTYNAVCLELGVFIDGASKKNVFENFEDVINDIIEKYSSKEITNLIKSTALENYWALYREYTHKNSENDIKKILAGIKREKDTNKLIEEQKNKIKTLEEKIKLLESKKAVLTTISIATTHTKNTFTDFILNEENPHLIQVTGR